MSKKQKKKIISIYIDVRNSSDLDESLDTKLSKHEKIFSQFSSYTGNWKNLSHRKTYFIGDGVLMLFNISSLDNEKEIINLFDEIDGKVLFLEEDLEIEMGIGVSYGLFKQGGNENLIVSHSINAAAHGSKITNKNYGEYTTKKWVLPLKKGLDDNKSVDQMKKLFMSHKPNKSKVSTSKKNLWFWF
ncbi:MAG: hypothetical protein NC236_02670 [Mycoplasma sp.]|nr:hypothetical protein [Mycoplasma sp.]